MVSDLLYHNRRARERPKHVRGEAFLHGIQHSENLQMFRTHVSRNLCLEILEHARFIPQPNLHIHFLSPYEAVSILYSFYT